MKALVTFACEEEFGPWRGRHRFESVRVGDQMLEQARIGDAEVAVLLTGIGPKIAGASVMGALMARMGIGGDRPYDICISTGLAGSLRPEFAAGDILAARAVVAEYDNGARPPRAVFAHPTCIGIAEHCGARLVARFRTSSHLILTAREKERLSSMADAVEMESFEILTESLAWGVPGIAVRAVGDTAAEDMPIDFNIALTSEGTISKPRIALALLNRPAALLALLRFARQSRDAAISLADYLDRFVVELAAQVQPGDLLLAEAVAAT
jgi:adenosylhomocysteine nucleosidase